MAGATGSAALAATYNYDGQGRLQQVRTDDAKQTRYTLDAAGNRTTVASSANLDNAPTAVDISVQTANAAVQIDPLSVGTGSNRTLAGIGKTQFGVAVVNQTTNTITYTPATHHPAAVDSFAYTVQRPNGLTASAIINVTLTNNTVTN